MDFAAMFGGSPRPMMTSVRCGVARAWTAGVSPVRGLPGGAGAHAVNARPAAAPCSNRRRVASKRIASPRSTNSSSGMPAWKYLSNRLLTITENVVLGQNLGDFHSGFRVYVREVLETIPWERNSDDFVFDSQFLAQVAWFGFRLGDAPVPCRYFEEASSINFPRSVRYGFGTLGTLGQFLIQKSRLGRFPIFETR